MDQDGSPQDQPYQQSPLIPGPEQYPQQQFPATGFPGQPGGQFGYVFPENSQASTALILGLLGLLFCAICAPFAWSIGQKEIDAIDAGRRDPSKRDIANAGKILGIIGTVLLVASILFLVVFVIFFGFLGVVGSATS